MAVTIYPLTVSSTDVMMSTPRWQSNGIAGLRKAIFCFGHGGDSRQIMQSSGFGGGLMGYHATYLADKGYAVAAIDYGGSSFLNPEAMGLLVALDDYLNSIGGVGKTALFAHSMGGGNALRFAQENPTRISCIYLNSPLTDLDYFHNISTYTAEIDAAYNNKYTTDGSPRSPIKNAAAFQNFVPMRIVHPTDDATVPYSQSQAFITAVNDPQVAMRQPDITGGHNGGLLNIDPRESWEWIRTHWAD